MDGADTPNRATAKGTAVGENAVVGRAPSASPPGIPSAPLFVAPAAPASSVAAFSAEKPAGTPSSFVAEGLSAADALRRAGRFAEAANVLERVLAEHGGEGSASLAEFSLGRLYLDSMNDPSRSSVHFARALARGLPSALAEDAAARLVEANARGGNLPGARDAASRYHSQYPNGRYASDVDRWSSFSGSPPGSAP
jgi:hypothetical protein